MNRPEPSQSVTSAGSHSVQEGTAQGHEDQEGEVCWGLSWRLGAKHGSLLKAEGNRREIWSLPSRDLHSKASYVETDMGEYELIPISFIYILLCAKYYAK